jgi:hypothetical protein
VRPGIGPLKRRGRGNKWRRLHALGVWDRADSGVLVDGTGRLHRLQGTYDVCNYLVIALKAGKLDDQIA